MLEVFKFFSDDKTNDYKLAQFRADWMQLTTVDKKQLVDGIKDGSFNY